MRRKNQRGTGCICVSTSDNVRYVVKWKGKADCHLLQGRPIRLWFHVRKAKLYSFEPRILHNHYLQAYD